MNEELLKEISQKLNVIISLSLRQLTGQKGFGKKEKRKQGIGELARYLADMGLSAKETADILGAPVTSIRTFLTPTRRK